jgi:hypothetical protein
MKRASSVLAFLAGLTATGAIPAALHDAAEHAKQCAAGIVRNCTVDSTWSDSSTNFGFGACSTTCGQGIATRARDVLHIACNGGKPCPPLTQSEECMVAVCDCAKVRCKWEVMCVAATSPTLCPHLTCWPASCSDPHVRELPGRTRSVVPLRWQLAARHEDQRGRRPHSGRLDQRG